MSESADELEARWRKHIPPEVPLEDVMRLVEARFPMQWRSGTSGSHLIVVEDPDLRLAEKAGLVSGTRGGILTISVVRGRYVKKWLVRSLLQAIDAKRKIEQARGSDA